MDILEAIKKVKPESPPIEVSLLRNQINQFLLQQEEEDLFCLIAACCCAMATKRKSFVNAMDYIEDRDKETRDRLVRQTEVLENEILKFLHQTEEVSRWPMGAMPREAAECIMLK